MGDLARAVEASDGPWPFLAIAIIGLYVLVWRFGGQLLNVARENNTVAKDARSTANQISSAISTNHGSKNLGDSVDRLSEWMLLHLEESRNSDEALSKLRSEFVHHIAQTDDDRARLIRTLAEVDERLAAVERAKE